MSEPPRFSMSPHAAKPPSRNHHTCLSQLDIFSHVGTTAFPDVKAARVELRVKTSDGSQERRCQSFVIEDLTNKHRTKTTCGVVSTWFLVFKSILKKHMIKFTSVTVSSYQYLLDAESTSATNESVLKVPLDHGKQAAGVIKPHDREVVCRKLVMHLWSRSSR
ncbi:hypothetical protein YC2023_077801 [Brassica napus]